MSASFTPIGILGGTFDPIHYGHLRSAVELLDRLSLAQLRLMPCATPPHRALPQRTAQQRLAMVELAIAGEQRLRCDARELHRSGPSYTIDSLIELRSELDENSSMCLIVGCDALHDLPSWHRWQELLDWAHLIVIARPGWSLPEGDELAGWIETNTDGDINGIRSRKAGYIYFQELRPMAISSTEIRDILAVGNSARYLTPESVLGYIDQYQLYLEP